MMYNIGLALIQLTGQIGYTPLCYQSDQLIDSDSEEFKASHTKHVFWMVVFMASKIPEMLDTIWLVLNKKEVITLQWWHHLTVMLYCWAQGVAYPDSGDGMLFAFINSFVHSIMYPYYALSIPFPCVRHPMIRMSITILQISQMVVGILLRMSYQANCTPIYPDRQRWVGIAGWVIYGSYLFLFAKFFADQYVFKAKSNHTKGDKKMR